MAAEDLEEQHKSACNKERIHDRNFASKLASVRDSLSIEEKALDQKLHELRQDEIKRITQESGGFHPAQLSIVILRDTFAPSSILWKTFHKMPKGAVLHAHLDSMVDVKWIIREIREMGNCYMRFVNDRPEFHFFPLSSDIKQNNTDGDWIQVNQMRMSFKGGPEEFDCYLVNHLTLEPFLNHHKTYTTLTATPDSVLWDEFIECFTKTAMILNYVPFFKKYVYETMRSVHHDGGIWLEERFVLRHNGWYDYNNRGEKVTVSPIDVVGIFQDTVNDYKREHPTFIGAKIIHSGVRVMDLDEGRKDLSLCLDLKEQYPNTLAAFDFVGYEDPGHSLEEYLPDIFWFKRQIELRNLDISFVWHAGETLGRGNSADENLFDAIHLQPKRLGHGLSLLKYPYLQSIVRKKEIAVELCPISNVVLKYVPTDLRAHPLISFLHNDVPIVVAPDDPAIFGVGEFPLTYDFWLIYLSWDLDLAALKMMVFNSIQFALANHSEKENLNKLISEQWTTWVAYTLSHLK